MVEEDAVEMARDILADKGMIQGWHGKRFPRAVGVFLDGDCPPGVGCCLMPGSEAPESVVFEDLASLNWADLWIRLLRDTSVVADACEAGMALTNHHDWIPESAKRLMVGGNVLWHMMCAEWVARCLKAEDFERIKRYIEDRLADYS